jgi:uncharacterized protein YggE
MTRKTLLIAMLAALPALSQTTTARVRSIVAYGEGTVSVRPDMAKVNVGVITADKSATDAAGKNAEQATAVINAVKQVLGSNAEVRTISYNVGPTYTYAPGGGAPTLTGFQVTNIVQATVPNTTQIGQVVDAAIQAGANRIDGISFGLKDDASARAQALRAAAQQARQKADTIAAGLSVRVGGVIMASEGYQYVPVAAERSGVNATSVATPVEAGTLDIRATVTLQLEISQ